MGEEVTALRRVLADKTASFDLSGAFGTALLCLLISAWLHLVFFIAWQHLNKDALESFSFQLEGEALAIELTLFAGEVPEPEEFTADDEEPLTPEEQEALETLERYIAEAQAQGEASGQAALEALSRPHGEEGGAVAAPEEMSVEAEAPAFKSYYTAIRRAINQRWVLPPEAKNQFRPSRLTCDFTIARDGSLLRIVVIESSGNATLDHAGLEALRAAAPFPPFSPELAAYSQLDIRMQFDYQARYISR